MVVASGELTSFGLFAQLLHDQGQKTIMFLSVINSNSGGGLNDDGGGRRLRRAFLDGHGQGFIILGFYGCGQLEKLCNSQRTALIPTDGERQWKWN